MIKALQKQKWALSPVWKPAKIVAKFAIDYKQTNILESSHSTSIDIPIKMAHGMHILY